MEKGGQYTRISHLLSNGRISEAAEAIENAKNELPLPVYLECVGNLHFYRREFQRAIGKYEEAMRVDHEYHAARHHYLIGVQEERGGNYVEAFKHFQSAIEAEPQFVDAYVELGGLLVKVGDHEGALTSYSDALRLEPSDLRHYWNRVQVLKRLDETDKARYGTMYREALGAFHIAKTKLPGIGEVANWNW
jgi:tetratricopeptide (TPR) repeat protein